MIVYLIFHGSRLKRQILKGYFKRTILPLRISLSFLINICSGIALN